MAAKGASFPWREVEPMQAPEAPDTRELIMQAAMAKFAERGYHETKVSDIVGAAGLAQGTLYLHFANKREVLAAVLERINEEFVEAALPDQAAYAAVDDPEDLRATVVRSIERLLGVMVRRRSLLLSLQLEMLQAKESASSEFADLFRDHEKPMSEFTELIRQAKERQVIRCAAEPEVIAYALRGAVFGVAESLAERGLLEEPEASGRVAEELADLFVYGLSGEAASGRWRPAADKGKGS